MATFKDLHIENSKNYKKWYCPHRTDCVSMCCCRYANYAVLQSAS